MSKGISYGAHKDVSTDVCFRGDNYTIIKLCQIDRSYGLHKILASGELTNIARLSLLTMTDLNHMREMLLFVCSKMAD